MGKFGRREGNENKVKGKSRHHRHGLLSVVAFDHQEVYRSVKPFITSLNNAAISLANWSLREENLAIQDACTRMYELSCLTSTIIEEFSMEYLALGRSLKDLLCQEMDLTTLSKKVCQAEEKAAKLKKQNIDKEAKEREKKKGGVALKRLSLLEELGNAELIYEEQKASFDAQTTKHEILKAKCLRESLIQLAESTTLLAKRLPTISYAQDELAKAIPVVPTQITGCDKYQGTGYFDEIVQKAADSLNITRPLPFNELQTGKNQRKNDHASCFYTPPSPSAPTSPSGDWVMVEPLIGQGRFDQQMLASLKNRLGVQGTQGISYISNRGIEERLALKHRGLQPDITKKLRPPVPPPRPSPCSSPPNNATPPRTPIDVPALMDFPQVEPYAISRRVPNNQGLYARADLFNSKRLWRSWSGESQWWTGQEEEKRYVGGGHDDEKQSDELNDKEEVVYAVLEKESEENSNNSHYLDVLQ